MKKIYDGFTLFNELDLLEIRFEEMYGCVDYFIIVEADHTFTNIPKPYYFEENAERYARFSDKIRYIKHKSKLHADPWQNETDQRNAISEGYCDAEPGDVVIISDVDEILRATVIDSVRASDNDICAFRMPLFHYMFNWMNIGERKNLAWAMAAKFPIIDGLTPQTLRDQRFSFFEGQSCSYKDASCVVFDHSGWHFSYMGDIENIRRKQKSFSHANEVNHVWCEKYDSTDNLRLCHITAAPFTTVELDSYFPSYMVSNAAKYQSSILNDAKYTVRAFLKFEERVSMKMYHIHENYNHKDTVGYFDDTPFKDEWQREVYEYARSVAERDNLSFIVDYGCGSAFKLLSNFSEYRTVGIDLEPTVKYLRETYPNREWDSAATIYEGVDMLIASDVIEHLINPDALLEYIKACAPKEIILSTPDRNLLCANWGQDNNGPAANASHVREWNFDEFRSYIAEHFDIVHHAVTNVDQCTQMIHCRMKS